MPISGNRAQNRQGRARSIRPPAVPMRTQLNSYEPHWLWWNCSGCRPSLPCSSRLSSSDEARMPQVICSVESARQSVRLCSGTHTDDAFKRARVFLTQGPPVPLPGDVEQTFAKLLTRQGEVYARIDSANIKRRKPRSWRFVQSPVVYLSCDDFYAASRTNKQGRPRSA